MKDALESSSATQDNGIIVGNLFCGKEYSHLVPQSLSLFAEQFPSIHINRVENPPGSDSLGDGNCIMLAHDSKFGFGSDRDTPDAEEEELECDEDGMCSPVDRKTASRNKKKFKRLHRGVCDSSAARKTAERIFDDQTMKLYNHFTSFPFSHPQVDPSTLC